jgi:hypothetical protein
MKRRRIADAAVAVEVITEDLLLIAIEDHQDMAIVGIAGIIIIAEDHRLLVATADHPVVANPGLHHQATTVVVHRHPVEEDYRHHRATTAVDRRLLRVVIAAVVGLGLPRVAPHAVRLDLDRRGGDDDAVVPTVTMIPMLRPTTLDPSRHDPPRPAHQTRMTMIV